MGTLKPNTTYVYERADGVTYAREFGAVAEERFPIGWDYGKEPNKERTIFGIPFTEVAIYIQMHQAAKSNPTLQAALERAKIVYYMSKDNAS